MPYVGLVTVEPGRTWVGSTGTQDVTPVTAAFGLAPPVAVKRKSNCPGRSQSRSPGVFGTITFIVTDGSDRAAIGFCSDVTLAELGKILATPGVTPELKVQRALNFDGGSSSAFWFAGERGPFSISEQKRVRNFVAVVPR